MKLSRNIFMGYKTILLFIKEMFMFLKSLSHLFAK